jgi:hypothetical protein
VVVHAAAHAPKLLAPGTLDASAELAWIGVVLVVPYLAFVVPRRGRGQPHPAAPAHQAPAGDRIVPPAAAP